jgi:hypothetical protein
MDKHLVSVFTLVCIIGLLSQGMAVGLFQNDSTYQEEKTSKVNTLEFNVSSPILSTNDGFINLHFDESTRSMGGVGKPLIPMRFRTIEIPFRSTLDTINIKYDLSDILGVSAPLAPVSMIQQPDNAVSNDRWLDPQTYQVDSWYPEKTVFYRLSSGLNKENNQVTFIHLEIALAQYNPVKQVIRTAEHIQIDITHTAPSVPVQFPDEYDMVIIASDEFTPLLSPLVTHKDSVGITTKLVSLSEVLYGTYFPIEGRDDAEQLKYFIKNAREQWGCIYVMLVGNFKKIPVRYSSLETDTGGTYEELEFVSDLYYMDLYDAQGVFSSWDSDNDERYAEWQYPENSPMIDDVDMSPDVYVGRLACMNKAEVQTMVDKIITYETTAYGSEWFNRFIAIGGDTFDKSWEGGTDYNEGEVTTQQAIDDMTGFSSVKLWASLDTLYTDTIIDEISKGAGFTYFVGHGNPRHWSTHYNGDYGNWTEGLYNRDMNKFTNKDMYPILMVGGCHNSEIDATPLNMIQGILSEGLIGYFSAGSDGFGSYWTSNWVPECWSWYFVKVPDGGAIASMGSTGYGGVNIGDYDTNDIPDCIEGADGWFETQFFRLYHDEGFDVLGETYGQTVADYIEGFPVFSNRYDAKIIQTHILLGDPSLKVGGYE